MAYLPPFAAMYERKHKRGILHQFLVLLPLNALYGTNYVATNEIHTIHANKHPTTRRNRAGFRSSTRRRTVCGKYGAVQVSRLLNRELYDKIVQFNTTTTTNANT